jgi:lysophospholipase L1-like esterase
LAWVDLDASLQWRFFRLSVEILKRRGNRVLVLVGPFNEHMLEGPSRAAYVRIRRGIERWLRETGTDFCAPPTLPREQYADASHPFAPGYAAIARQLHKALLSLQQQKLSKGVRQR